MADTGARERIRDEAEKIISLASGPWSEGENLPDDLREPMIVRSEWYRRHAQAILDALAAGVGVPPDAARIDALRVALKQIRRESTYRGPDRLRTIAREAMEADERALAGVGVPPTTTHAADGRAYSDRDYIDRTIATIRQHEPNRLRENWWTGAALALADEVDRLRAGVGEARPAEPAASVAETMKGQLP